MEVRWWNRPTWFKSLFLKILSSADPFRTSRQTTAPHIGWQCIGCAIDISLFVYMQRVNIAKTKSIELLTFDRHFSIPRADGEPPRKCRPDDDSQLYWPNL